MLFYTLIPIYLTSVIDTFLDNTLKSIVFSNEQTKDSNLIYIHSQIFNIKITTYDSVVIGAYLIIPDIININTKYVIILHGNNTNRKRFTNDYNLMERANNENLIMLVPDYRDFGDSEGEFNMETVVYDLDACMRFMKDVANNKNVDVFAHSLGTAIILKYMKYVHENSDDESQNYRNYSNKITNIQNIFKENGEYDYHVTQLYKIKPNKIVLVSTFRIIDDIIKHITNSPSFLKTILNDIVGFFDERLGIDNIGNIKFVNRDKLMVIHSSNDELIPIESAYLLVKEMGIYLYKVEDAKHAETFANEKVWRLMVGFINKDK